MAITRDDFQNIPSTGFIPADRLPASAFAVSYFFEYSGYPSLTTFNHTFSGKIVLHFKNGEAIKYVVEIEQTYNLFIFPLAPGLVLYTWNWVPSAEKISGRKGEDPDAAAMATLGLATFGVDPAEGSGTSDMEVIVSSRFYSGIFTEPLVGGDLIKIVFHNLSAGFVVNRASLQLAVERVTRLVDSVRGWFGEIVAARPLGGVPSRHIVQGGHSWPFHRRLTARAFIRGASEPSLVMLPDGREILGVLQGGGYWEYESLDTQMSWQRVEYPIVDDVRRSEPAPIFEEGVTMPQLIFLEIDNVRLALGRVNNDLIVRRISDMGLGDVKRVAGGVGGASYSLSVAEDGVVSISDESGLPRYQSEDGGLSWQELAELSAEEVN